MLAILIHGVILYGSYLSVYLVNGWLKEGFIPIIVFTVIFTLGYIIVWIIICSVTKKNTEMVNEMLKKKQQSNR